MTQDRSSDAKPIGFVNGPLRSPAAPSQLLPIARFGIVGILQNLAAFALVVGLIHLGLAPWLAFAVTFPLSVFATYWLHACWTFGQRGRGRGAPALYALVYVLAYLLAMAISYGLEQIGMPGWINAGTTILAVGAFTFLVLDRGVFRRRPSSGAP